MPKIVKWTNNQKLLLEKAFALRGEKEYKKGVIDAMSIAVNQFNCPDYIRTGVFEIMKIK